MDYQLILGGLAVGLVVGLTGMGGGALMTPMLVFFFGINPLAAVSSDLVAAAVMKPFGGAVHAARRTVDWKLVGWLAIGSVPSGFAGVFVLRAFGEGSGVDKAVMVALGVALVVAALALVVKAYVTMTRRRADAAAKLAAGETTTAGADEPRRVNVRPVPTVLIGIVGGLVVGMTSVGSGSLVIIALMLLYPVLRPKELVGTDLVQAVPLVAAAALGHLFFGDFQLALTVSLLIGSIPGAVVGALLSTRAPAGLIRRALTVVLMASGLKLLGVSTPATAIILAACVLAGPVMWMLARRHHGLTPSPLYENRIRKSLVGAGSGPDHD